MTGRRFIFDLAAGALDCQKITIAAEADIQYLLIQNDPLDQDSFRTRQFYLKENARLELITLIIGGATSDLIQEVYLQDVGAESLQKIVVIGNGEQKINLVANNIHEAVSCRSDIAVKTILSGTAQSAFNGLIKIKSAAQQTDAYLRHDAYVLSDGAKNITIPGLEIDANDIRASHSASQSQLSSEDLLYLTSRGLIISEAQQLILEGFVQPIIERVKEGGARSKVAALLAHKLRL